MAYSSDNLIERLKGIADTIAPVDYNSCGFHVEAIAEPSKIREIAKILHEDEFYLVFVTAVHMKPQLTAVYQFAHFEASLRLNVRVALGSEQAVPTITDIFHGADWHERETRDLLGVVFEGHPNLIPLILCEEDVDLKPLLKDEKSLKDAEKVTRKDASSENPEKKPLPAKPAKKPLPAKPAKKPLPKKPEKKRE